MEDGTICLSASLQLPSNLKNDETTPVMDETCKDYYTELNGDKGSISGEESDTSESDALVIDESVPKHKKYKKKRTQTEKKSSEGVVTHSNPFFNESLFELSQQHHIVNQINEDPENLKLSSEKLNKTKGNKAKPKPKLNEYAQYLGLQPAVQFKCSKCGEAGFQSLTSLQEHLAECKSIKICDGNTLTNEHCSGFKLTRRVFLCSACGTYYENWNLYMHMLEFHKRYICLYCLRLFSLLEDLCQHIQNKHHLEPGQKESLDEFFSTYSEPCYIVCCECNKLFNEQDNFFYHNCIGNKGNSKKLKPIRSQILPENHITGDYDENHLESNDDEPSDEPKQALEPTEDFVCSDDKGTYATTEYFAAPEQQRHIETESVNMTESANKEPCDINEPEEDSSKECTENLVKTVDSEDLQCSSNMETPTENQEEKIDSPNPSHDESPCQVSTQDSVTESLIETNDYNEECLPNDKSAKSGDSQEEKDSELSENSETQSEPIETRKVPKLSLKLPKLSLYSAPEPEDSDDSEKLTMEVEAAESDIENDNVEAEIEAEHNEDAEVIISQKEGEEANSLTADEIVDNLESQIQIASPDIPVVELELETPLDKIDIRVLLQKCLKATVPTCIYCNHARKIAVNGQQLGLHAIAEHRFSAIVQSITAEELIPESFVLRIKESLDELSNIFFSLDSGPSEEAVTFSHLFECFQCYYSATVHKELYLHNRKFHSKNLLLCIMCKSNFYSYSELICHLCPGIYILDYDVQFRCCMCVSDDLPSAFRLMVHLRKRHNVCDVCLEMCHNQYKLSNHVWKHKLHHFCYRCGIAYRNKPDITRHLFWKHGTESILCKRCLQKKWPHVYHFCVPPASFTCEECSLVFSKAIYLKVHKRLHTDEKKHHCTFEGCTEKFISKKLMIKHEMKHNEPPEEEETYEKTQESIDSQEDKEELVKEIDKQDEEPAKTAPKPKIDVYDLPELNLSESDSSDSETDEPKKLEAPVPDQNTNIEETSTIPVSEKLVEDLPAGEQKLTEEVLEKDGENSTEVIVNIWDNFKNYQASKEKLDHMFTEPEKHEDIPDIPIPEVEEPLTLEKALMDHDYCINPEQKTDTSIIEVKPALTLTERVDHDYCFHKEGVVAGKPPIEEESGSKSPAQAKKTESSSSSTDSDSSCSCGSNCSCSSSSGSSSSSSDASDSESSTEEGRQRQQIRKQKRKQKNAEKQSKTEGKIEVDVVATDQPQVVPEVPIVESDLETTESETDEEFYDRQPHMIAKKLLEEKKAKILAELGPNSVPNGSFIESNSRPPTPPAGSVMEEEHVKPKKKKTKKRKKKKSERREKHYGANTSHEIPEVPYYQHYQPPVVAPITLSINRNSPTQVVINSNAMTPQSYPKAMTPVMTRHDSTDSHLRSSKRRRVPNKFYGYSSDEDEKEKAASVHPPKWRKIEVTQSTTPRSPLTVPPITIKTGPPPAPHPTVEPISIKLPAASHPGDFKIRQKPRMPPIRLLSPKPKPPVDAESGSDSNDSDADQLHIQAPVLQKPNQPQLYCYCRCPYDEVSEMIGCDSSECEIEWFHFECVGIMVPPKGQWFCPDCRKKKQQRTLLAG